MLGNESRKFVRNLARKFKGTLQFVKGRLCGDREAASTYDGAGLSFFCARAGSRYFSSEDRRLARLLDVRDQREARGRRSRTVVTKWCPS